MNLKTAVRFVVPVLIAVYLVLFWTDVAGAQLSAAGFPRLLIACIGLLVVVEITREVRNLRRNPAADIAAEGIGDEPPNSAPRERPFETWTSGTGLNLKEWMAAPAWRRNMPMIAIIVFLLAYWFLLPRIGAYPSTALFVAGLSVVLGYRKPLLIIVSTVICVALVGGFIRLFNLPLPTFWS
jgi:hypothetical protein